LPNRHPRPQHRKAETEFELQDGQSFVIAGLLDNRVTNIANKILFWAISRFSQFFQEARATRRATQN